MSTTLQNQIMIFLLLGLDYECFTTPRSSTIAFKHSGSRITTFFLLRANYPATLIPTSLALCVPYAPVSEHSSCTTFFPVWSYADEASTSLSYFPVASAGAPITNSETSSSFLEESFLRDSAVISLYRSILSKNGMAKALCSCLLFNTELSLTSWKSWFPLAW